MSWATATRRTTCGESRCGGSHEGLWQISTAVGLLTTLVTIKSLDCGLAGETRIYADRPLLFTNSCIEDARTRRVGAANESEMGTTFDQITD